MAENMDRSGSSKDRGGKGNGKLYTLTEVSNLTGISMPTLQRYKKDYQDRIPSEGRGRTQRYPQEALDIFTLLKEENMKRRGRPRKNAVPDEAQRKRGGRPRAVPRVEKAAANDDTLLTLKQIEDMTGISYPTLLRYVKTNISRIPHVGSGRKRRFPPQAVNEFKILREESRRGRRSSSKPTPAITPAATARRRVSVSVPPPTVAVAAPPAMAAVPSADLENLMGMVKELQKSHVALQRQVQHLEKELAKPFKVVLKR
jgi:predicted DNA-binding transcriptional regulator AlpA